MAFPQLEVGAFSEWSRTVSDQDIISFANLSGDDNPVHVDEEVAMSGPFGGRIAHGMLIASFISAAMVKGIPGPGSVYLSQSLNFRSPVRPGDYLTVRIEITDIRPRTKRIFLKTTVRNQDSNIVLDGDAAIMLPSMTTGKTEE